MSSQEILEKAIQKAIDGGWGKQYFPAGGPLHPMEWGGKWTIALDGSPLSVDEWLYNHDFAEALFGNDLVCEYCGIQNDHDPYCSERTFSQRRWQHKLKEMVLEQDPIAYLGANI